MKIIIAIFLLFSSVIYSGKAQKKPTGLLIDLLAGPSSSLDTSPQIVVLSSYPSFSWVVPGKQQGTVQTAYQILVSKSKNALTKDIGNVWNSGRVASANSVSVMFKGIALKPLTNYFVKIKVYTNKDGESNWSDIKAFSTGVILDDYKSSSERLVKTGQEAKLLPTASNNYQLFDFKKDAFGQVNVRLSSSTGSDSVIIHMGENLLNNKVDPKPGGTIRYRRQVLTLSKGTHSYQVKLEPDKRNTGPAAIKMPEYIGEVLPFRYVAIEGYGHKIPAQNVTRAMVHYPFNDQSAYFKSSNDTLNQVWELSKYSMKATSFAGIYVDGDRERIPYEADALINQLGHYAADREFSIARSTSEYLLQKPTWPTEWILQALIISWNDYLYTGDSRSLASNYEILKNRTLVQLIDKNGLISTTTGLQTPAFSASIKFNDKIKDIVDWPLSETDGFRFTNYNAVTNAFHYKALLIMEEIAKLLKHTEDADFYHDKSDKLKLVYNRTFLDKATGLYRDGDTTSHSSLHTNMFAVAFGLVPKENLPKVMDFIQSRGMASSVYGAQFLLESLYEGASADYALSLLCSGGVRSWYNMIRVGSTITLEAWDNKFKPNQDWNHAWGAAPANIISRKLIGVEPANAGCSTISIKPQIGKLSYAEALVPTIRGGVTVSIKNQAEEYVLNINIPANMEANVYLPLRAGNNNIFCNGKKMTVKQAAGKTNMEAIKILSGSYTFTMKAK
ncbi:alpha-L-rhamnosidase-related protein [Pedobacter sp. PWIIR3]